MSCSGGAEASAPSIPTPRRMTLEAPVGAQIKPSAHRDGHVVRRAMARAVGLGDRHGRRREPSRRWRRWRRQRPGGRGRRGCSPVRRRGARAGYQPGVEPYRRRATGARSTTVGASSGAATASRGVLTSTRTPPSAMVTASSGIAAEAADGLRPATEAPESTYSVAATGSEAVAATVLADEAKEKGDEAWHLTDVMCRNLQFIQREETRRSKGMHRFQGDATVAGDTGAYAGVTVRPLGKGIFPLITYVVINLNNVQKHKGDMMF